MEANEPAEESRTDLEITVCLNGVVNVHRPDSDRAHSVFLDVLGDVVRCSCKGHHFRGHCSHADAVEARPLVVSSALAAAASYHEPEDAEPTRGADAARAVADGGRVESDPEPSDLTGQTHCARCPTALAEIHDGIGGHTVVTTDGEELCPDCADARSGEEIGFGTDEDQQ